MTAVVVDSSVALKWFIPEDLSQEAERLLEGSFELLAPDLLFPGFGNILWKKKTRGEIEPKEARDILGALKRVPLEVVSSAGLIEAALEIAISCERTVYDAVYLALAVSRDCPLVTADDRLARSLAKGPLRRHVRGLRQS